MKIFKLPEPAHVALDLGLIIMCEVDWGGGERGETHVPADITHSIKTHTN